MAFPYNGIFQVQVVVKNKNVIIVNLGYET